MALAILNISSSVPLCLNELTATSTNLQLSCMYPFEGSMRSIDGENILGPGRPSPVRMKGINEISQCPVHRDFAHSTVKLKDFPVFLARCFADSMVGSHG